MSTANVTVIILTYNEEKNIAQAIRSVAGWARAVFILDSLSQDRTTTIAREMGAEVFEHPFSGYASQRNHALDHLPIRTEWILFLDADEWVPADLREEISDVIARHPTENGFYIKRRLIWMGRWIRRGYYPVWILRLFRHRKGRCEAREINEHIVVEGPTGHLHHDFIHEDHRSVTDWVAKHNRYATAEAAELMKARDTEGELPGRLFGTQPERKRWVRHVVWNRLPPLVRPAAYFGYRYLARGGFLDGPEAFAYHVLQGLWFQTLVDVKFMELRREKERGSR